MLATGGKEAFWQKGELKTNKDIVGIERPLSLMLLWAQHHLKAANEAYQVLKPKAPMLQQDFLQEHARDTSSSEKEQKAARRLLQTEQMQDNC